jgi:hypothetical protein
MLCTVHTTYKNVKIFLRDFYRDIVSMFLFIFTFIKHHKYLTLKYFIYIMNLFNIYNLI